MKKKLLTVEQAANKIGVSEEQVYKYIQEGCIGVIFPSAQGYLVREEECIRLSTLLKKQMV